MRGAVAPTGLQAKQESSVPALLEALLNLLDFQTAQLRHVEQLIVFERLV
jgi:hypothetical protein